MTTTTAPTLVKVEDHEGFGTCGHCGREGLRWVATLSDGSTVGVSCGKKLMGWKIATKDYNWVADFAPVAEHREGRDGQQVWVMWQHKAGTQTRETINGSLNVVGGVRQRWQRRGWL